MRPPLDLEKVKKTSIKVTSKIRKLKLAQPYIPPRPKTNILVDSDTSQFESTKETPPCMFQTDFEWKCNSTMNSRNAGLISAIDSVNTNNTT